MKLKAVHLLRRLERIDRDLEELDHLQNAIREDREYADRLRNSLIDESTRLNDLKKRVMTQVVHRPPQELIDKINGHSTAGAVASIELPGATGVAERESVQSAQEQKPTSDQPSSDKEINKNPAQNNGNRQNQANRPEKEKPAGEKKKKGSSGPPFRFVYQKDDE